MKLQSTKGFTLIELLVVITIIGILATGATTTYTSQIQKARDTTRINDIKALQGAVEQVYQDSGEFPKPTEFNTGTSVNVSTYIPKLPRDPKNGQTCNNTGKTGGANVACVYSYAVGPDSNNIHYGAYVLSTSFESKGKVDSDGKRDGGLYDYRWETGNGISLPTKIPSEPDPTCIDTTISNSSTKGIRSNTCDTTITNNAAGKVTITIHGS